MQKDLGWRALAVGLGTTVMALGLITTAAQASTVTTDFGSLIIAGEDDDDVITVSTDGPTLTVTDTGTGGAIDNDVDCAQVNATTVACGAYPGTEDEVSGMIAFLGAGVDSFTNVNFITEFAQIGAPEELGAKTISGGPGDQFLFGGLEDDNLDGGDGDDVLFDGSGDVDTVSSGGNDNLVGGPGEDAADYFRTVDVSITLDTLANDGQAGELDNVQVENVSTGDGNDTLVGDGGPNILSAGEGMDVVSGLAGNDSLSGDFGSLGNIAIRGLVVATDDADTLNGGPGRDGLDCGPGLDTALRDPFDEVETNCERIGADVVGDSAAVTGKKKNKFKVELACPESESVPCVGTLGITAGGKKVATGKFSVAAGQSKAGKAKLSKKGAKKLKAAGGSLLVTVLAQTTEPGGIAESSGRILVHD